MCYRFLLCAAYLGGTPAFCQDVAVNRENRTISVVATETIRVNPDSASVSIGYRNFAESRDAAYAENLKTANWILDVLMQAGLPKEAIQSSKLSFEYEVEEPTGGKPKRLLFVAHQSWTIRVTAPDAQKVVESAVKAGANEVNDVDWFVADQATLEAQALAAALARARKSATDLAVSSGQKLGSLLYLNNNNESETRIARFWYAREIQLPASELRLFPRMVEQKATVRAVFALE